MTTEQADNSFATTPRADMVLKGDIRRRMVEDIETLLKDSGLIIYNRDLLQFGWSEKQIEYHANACMESVLGLGGIARAATDPKTPVAAPPSPAAPQQAAPADPPPSQSAGASLSKLLEANRSILAGLECAIGDMVNETVLFRKGNAAMAAEIDRLTKAAEKATPQQATQHA